jgi:predicted anti-sigma-YlaC factor YlaD
MNCKEVKKNLCLFLEDTLSPPKRSAMESHLMNCSSCSKLLEEFSPLWGIWKNREIIQPPPYLWTRLKKKIDEYEQGKQSVWSKLKRQMVWARPVVTVAVLGMCIFAGYLLGNLPQSANGQTTYQVDERTTALQQFMASHYLNRLNDLPTGSVEATYLDVVSGE